MVLISKKTRLIFTSIKLKYGIIIRLPIKKEQATIGSLKVCANERVQIRGR